MNESHLPDSPQGQTHPPALHPDAGVPEQDTNGRRDFLKNLVAASVPAACLAAAAQAKGPRGPGPNNGGNDEDASQFRAIQQHENDHVAFLVNALGSYARPKPTFRNLLQTSKDQFIKVSRSLENTGAGAYLNAAPAINNAGYLAAAGSIAIIEARHAGWLDTISGVLLTTDVYGTARSFEKPLTAAQVVSLAGNFIANLNGGPPLTYSDTRSDANDLAILNFALALEYLEAEFYNLNVPRFFRQHDNSNKATRSRSNYQSAPTNVQRRQPGIAPAPTIRRLRR